MSTTIARVQPVVPRRAALVMVIITLAACLAGILSKNIYALAVPIALGIVVLCVAAALWNFPVLIMTLLVLRPLLDATKSSSQTGFFQPTTFVSVALLIVGPLWLLAQRRVSRAPITSLTIGVLAMLATFAVSTISSVVPSTSAIETLKAAAWVMMFLVVRRVVDSERRLRQLLIAIAISAVLPALLAAYEALTPGAGYFAEVKDGVIRVRSTFDLSNDYARYLMMLILVGLALAPVLSKVARRWVFAGVGVSVLLLITTYTRSVFIGVAVGIIVIAVMQRRRLLIGAMVGGFAIILLVPQTSSHITQVVSSASANHATNDSVAWRFAYWKDVWALAKIDPITGIGPGTTALVTTAAKEPHNEYLRALAEDGILGEVAYLVFLGTAIATGRRVAKRCASRLARASGVAFTSLAVAVTVASVASNVVLGVSFMWYFAALAAIADRLSWEVLDRRGELPLLVAETADDPNPASAHAKSRSLAWT